MARVLSVVPTVALQLGCAQWSGCSRVTYEDHVEPPCGAGTESIANEGDRHDADYPWPSSSAQDVGPAWQPSSRCVALADDLVARMTLHEKVGQMTQAERESITPRQVTEYEIGSVISGGGSYPGNGSATAWADMTDKLHQAAALLETVHALGIPAVVVLLSGRPLIIEPQLPLAPAWVAAWLPGTEGAGVADVLFGEVAPTAKLSHAWPARMDQIPINADNTDYERDPPLFPLGYGLSWRERAE